MFFIPLRPSAPSAVKSSDQKRLTAEGAEGRRERQINRDLSPVVRCPDLESGRQSPERLILDCTKSCQGDGDGSEGDAGAACSGFRTINIFINA